MSAWNNERPSFISNLINKNLLNTANHEKVSSQPYHIIELANLI
jgi:hypothetical protein